MIFDQVIRAPENGTQRVRTNHIWSDKMGILTHAKCNFRTTLKLGKVEPLVIIFIISKLKLADAGQKIALLQC